MKHFAPIAAAVAAFAALGLQPALAQNNNSNKKQIVIDPDSIISKPIKDFVPNKGCTFYENFNGDGTSWRIKVGWKEREAYNYVYFKEVLNQLGDYWNDRISSVSCESSGDVSCNAYLYEDVNLQGTHMLTITEANKIINLNQKNIGGYMLSAPWDKRVSSIVVECARVF